MSLVELLWLALGLSMDACAVSICLGLGVKEIRPRDLGKVGLWFGTFQAVMPLSGYYLGRILRGYLSIVDHWLSFVLLTLVGLTMLCGSGKERDGGLSLDVKSMLSLALATSIDAFAIGLGFALLPQIPMGEVAVFVGVCTFLLSALGLMLGRRLGASYSDKAELLGGLLLLGMGINILGEGLGFWL